MASDRIRVRLSHSCHFLASSGGSCSSLVLMLKRPPTERVDRVPSEERESKKPPARATALFSDGGCFPCGQIRQDPDGEVGGHHKQIGKLMSLFASSEFSSPATGSKFPLLRIRAAKSCTQAS